MFRRAVLASLLAAPALAQAYPNGPIRLIVPSPPGGGTDTLSRLLANRLAETLRWQIVVENRPGAGGNIGMDAAAKAPPDGHAIVMGESANLVINPYLYARLPFDPARDLAPIALVGTVPLVMISQAGGPLDTPASVVAAARARPLSYGSGGNGTVGHLAAEAWKRLAGVEIEHVVYRGGAPAVAAVAAGEVALHFGSIPAVAPMLEAGRVRAIAVTAGERLAQLAAVPTLAESGFPGFTAEVLYGLLAPAGTPAPVLERLNAEVNRALEAPALRAAMARAGIGVRGGSAAAFSALLEQERRRWSRAVRESGATVD
jgi:tripartite-type tricarboxylate transporter receptor subunit TctC